MLART